MQIEIKNIKKITLTIALVLFFSLGFYVFASVNEATNKNYLLDSDQDGLTDEEEKTYGTDSLKADTDGDGYSDGVELKNGYDPLKKAPGDKIVVKNENNTESESVENLTKKLAENLKPLLSSTENENKQISVDDIDNVLENSLGDSLNNLVTYESLPGYSVPEDKIIKQNYGNLAEADRREKIKEDTMNYLQGIVYILGNNMPENIKSADDLSAFVDSLIVHIDDLAKTPPDYSFYTPIGKKIQAVIDDAVLLSVPENMRNFHEKGIRILKAYIALGERAPSGKNDPIAQAIFIKKIYPMIDISEEYLRESYYEISEYVTGDKK